MPIQEAFLYALQSINRAKFSYTLAEIVAGAIDVEGQQAHCGLEDGPLSAATMLGRSLEGQGDGLRIVFLADAFDQRDAL